MMTMRTILVRLGLCMAVAGIAWSAGPSLRAQDQAQDQSAPGSAAPPPLSELEPDPPDWPREDVPPAYAPQQDPMCGRLEMLLKKRMPAAERHKAVETHRSLHCPAPAVSGSAQSHARRRKAGR